MMLNNNFHIYHNNANDHDDDDRIQGTKNDDSKHTHLLTYLLTYLLKRNLFHDLGVVFHFLRGALAPTLLGNAILWLRLGFRRDGARGVGAQVDATPIRGDVICLQRSNAFLLPGFRTYPL